MSAQASLVEPYVVVYAAYTLRGDAWGIGPEESGPGGWAAIVRRGSNRAEYAVHACHTTRAELIAACSDHVQVTFDLNRGGIDVVWIANDSGALNETQRADLEHAQKIARTYAISVHEVVRRSTSPP
jgi:hypothetical protein